jgi:hypothetical protein
MSIPGQCQSNVVKSPADGEFVASDREYLFEWDPTQLFFFEKNGQAHDGHVSSVDTVQIKLVGTRLLKHDEECRFGHQDAGLCVETTIITPREGVPNTGAMMYDFSTALDGYGGLLTWNGTWYGRYGSLRVQISARDHSLIATLSSGQFYMAEDGNLPSPRPFCDAERGQSMSAVPPAGIALGLALADLPKEEESPSSSDGLRRHLLGSTGSLQSTGSLGMEVNFG